MRKHIFTHEDLYVGAELVCTYASKVFGRFNTVGEIYRVISNDAESSYPYEITDDTEDSNVWDLEELNDADYPEVSFYPLDQLTDKEKFMVKMSGRLPE